jgi:hypothetical protein
MTSDLKVTAFLLPQTVVYKLVIPFGQLVLDEDLRGDALSRFGLLLLHDFGFPNMRYQVTGGYMLRENDENIKGRGQEKFVEDTLFDTRRNVGFYKYNTATFFETTFNLMGNAEEKMRLFGRGQNDDWIFDRLVSVIITFLIPATDYIIQKRHLKDCKMRIFNMPA